MATIEDGAAAAASVSPQDIMIDFDLVKSGKEKKVAPASPTESPSPSTAPAPAYGTTAAALGTPERDHDTGEDQLITDFGPGGLIRASTKRSACPGDEATVAAIASSNFSFDPQAMLDRRITDEQGLGRRIVYDPTEIARTLQTQTSSNSSNSCCGSRVSQSTIDDITIAEGSSSSPAATVDDDASAILDRLASTLEMALDPDRPGCESLLICKAVTDAFLVNARRLKGCRTTADAEDLKDGYLIRALRVAWQHAVEHWGSDSDEPHSAADLHVTAAWFQAWWAADDASGGGEPTVSMLELHEMLPGDWDWVLDHLDTAALAQG